MTSLIRAVFAAVLIAPAASGVAIAQTSTAHPTAATQALQAGRVADTAGGGILLIFIR